MRFDVNDETIVFSKNQIKEFEKTEKGKWRYSNVEAWRGIACEIIISDWLEENFNVIIRAKGLDTSGNYDGCDMVIGNKKVEIKSATRNYFKYIMPKKYDIINSPKDIYVGAKYNDTKSPNEVVLLAYIYHSEILSYPIKKNKGAPYFEIPMLAFKDISEEIFI